MKTQQIHHDTFKKGSKTYFNSSLFFPRDIRRDVFILYGFVRVADDFVDSVPQDKKGFYSFKERYARALGGEITGDVIVDSFADLLRRKGFDSSWVEAFLHSMELDLVKKKYDTLNETLEYIYGSAEVIGLFMAKIMRLSEESYECAKLQGRAMQYINFIRDIEEDLALGRQYLPLKESTLDSLEYEYVKNRREAFTEFIVSQIALYREWQKKAEKGYAYIPRRFVIPIKTASDMYGWTANRIERDPLVVYDTKMKPKKSRIIFQVIKNALSVRLTR
jgi:phytoene synthase